MSHHTFRLSFEPRSWQVFLTPIIWNLTKYTSIQNKSRCFFWYFDILKISHHSKAESAESDVKHNRAIFDLSGPTQPEEKTLLFPSKFPRSSRFLGYLLHNYCLFFVLLFIKRLYAFVCEWYHAGFLTRWW